MCNDLKCPEAERSRSLEAGGAASTSISHIPSLPIPALPLYTLLLLHFWLVLSTSYALPDVMVKFFENTSSYDYSFPAVTLAYFLRYPNPYSRHVLSTDVIDRHYDADHQRLYTTRLHLKRSKIPPAMLKLLPKSVMGGGSDGAGQSYILERTVVDVKEGWMRTESRNMEWTGILSVIERQMYHRQSEDNRRGENFPNLLTAEGWKSQDGTDVTTTVTFQSRLGQGKAAKRKDQIPSDDEMADTEETPKKGILAAWSTASLQRTIEVLGVRRGREAVGKSVEGMNLVLERLRKGGVVGVLEGIRRDRETDFGAEGPWKRIWLNGQNGSADED